MVFVSHSYSGDASRKPVSYQGTCLRLHRAFASQVITKLAKQGLVEKLQGVRNEKEVLLKLTPKGLVVYHNHEKIHAVECGRSYQEIGSLSIKERPAIARVFSALEIYYDNGSGKNPSRP